MKYKPETKAAQSKRGKARMASLTQRQREDLASSGGRVGGPARAKALSPERRREIARAAAAKRWAKE